MTTPLEHAQFTLRKLDPEDTGGYLSGDTAVEMVSDETDDTGVVQFTGLADGYYEISETKTPAGYVLQGDGTFYIKIVNGVMKRIVKTVDDPATEDVNEGLVKNWPERTGDSDNISNVGTQPAVQDDPETTAVDESAEAITTYKVGNTPGEELPAAGGVGAAPVRVVGLALVGLAGLMLVRRRRLYYR